jgi:hypothetical protein
MINPPPAGWRRTLAAMQPNPIEYLSDALAAAGTRPDLLQAVHEGLARPQAQARDELLLALVLRMTAPAGSRSSTRATVGVGSRTPNSRRDSRRSRPLGPPRPS